LVHGRYGSASVPVAEPVVEPAAGTLPARRADGPAARPRSESEASPAFPGCTPVHLPRAELKSFDRRLEYWEAATETAWICEPVSPYHERPSRLLTRLAETISRVRGSRIECYGSMDLPLRDRRGRPQRIMQADESLYLHPDRARMPDAAMVVGQDDFPDVVLEVDHATDARRGKLPLYESWGFPEVWVDVPEAARYCGRAASRSRRGSPATRRRSPQPRRPAWWMRRTSLLTSMKETRSEYTLDLKDFVWTRPREVRPRWPRGRSSGRHHSAVRRVPMTVVGCTQEPEVLWIGGAAHCIRQDVVQLDQMS